MSRPSSFRWSTLLAFAGAVATAPCVASVVINEIHYAPDVKQEHVGFVELYNSGPAAVSLAGWYFSNGIDYRFPAGAVIPAEGYVVVAGDPAALTAKFGFSGAYGPWTGNLSGQGERLTLRDGTGTEMATVRYQLGFPWPTVGDAPGNSIELIHPGLDPDLGGNWRASTAAGSNHGPVVLIDPGAGWSYRKGTNEPSAVKGEWRAPDFDDSSWAAGPLPVGYDPDILGPAITGGTKLADMPGAYTTIYLRRRITVTGATEVGALRVEALYDDGYKLWVNGYLVAHANLSVAETPFNGVSLSTRENNTYESQESPIAPGILQEGENVIAVQVVNSSLAASSDCFFDCRLTALFAASQDGPTPGRRNQAYALNAPPAVRQVEHTPAQPHSGDTVLITARVTDPDGVAAVTLEYQVVSPGAYIRFDMPQYATDWTAIPMNDEGAGADVVAGDQVYTAAIPASVQLHRHLVRYRLRVRDVPGAEVQVPYADDPGRNFAYFVHDGVPAWTGSVHPGAAGAAGTPFTVGTNEMNRLPVYHLVALKDDVEAATWRDRSHGDQYFWTGTMVYDGRVYDHIRFRPRGGVWRYAMGKNMWKFDFNRGRDLEARDNWGKKYDTAWTKLNLGACIQQGDFLNRGEQGMFESVGFRLFQLAGVPAENTAYVQYRIVDEAAESKPNDQFSGDFWGIYLACEQPDGRFLSEHGLPDGNFYKMEGGFGDPNNLSADGPVNASDLSAFLNTYNGAAPVESWWRTNLNLKAYYDYQAVVQAIHHYDIADTKNYYYYRNPEDGRWTVVPWDLDLTWADNMYRSGQTGGDEPFKSRVLSGFATASPRYPAISMEFRNRVREVRDLLWNTDEAYRLIDEHVRLLRGTNQFSLLDADRSQWDYNPVMIDGSLTLSSKAGWGRFYQSGAGTKDFAGMVLKMKQYVGYRATNTAFSLDTMAREPNRPAKPGLTHTGPGAFPLNALRFTPGAYSGAGNLASVKWRIAEITRPGHPAYAPDKPLPYEIQPTWESAELGADALREFTFPATDLRVGRLYRARVRYTDDAGRTSNWSDPVEFTAGEPDTAVGAFADLEVSEVMYNPPPDGFEFLELWNRNSGQTVVLAGSKFTAGIQFEFPAGAVLGPGQYGLLLRSTNVAAFRAATGVGDGVAIFGSYDGSLANEGETLTLRAASGSTNELSFTYGVAGPWPSGANGGGRSLVPALGSVHDRNDPAYWRASTLPGGSPGRADPSPSFGFSSVSPQAGGLDLTYVVPEGVTVMVEVSSDLLTWRGMGAAPPGGRMTVPYALTGVGQFVRLRQGGP